MGELTRDQILNADDLPRRQVKVPEWGGEVWVRSLTAAELDQYELTLVQDVKGRENIRALLCSLTICDSQGKRLFSLEDVQALAAKNGNAMQRVFFAARKLNGLSQKDIEELEKNL